MNNFDSNIHKTTPKLPVSHKQKMYPTPLAVTQRNKASLSTLHIKGDNRTLGAILKNTGGGLSRFR